jgi:hypothetical protein
MVPETPELVEAVQDSSWLPIAQLPTYNVKSCSASAGQHSTRPTWNYEVPQVLLKRRCSHNVAAMLQQIFLSQLLSADGTGPAAAC